MSLRCQARIRIGSYDRGDPPQDLSAERLSFGGQSATLIVSESQASPARLELLLQDAVLFNQVGDHARLMTANPTGESGQEELKMDGFNHAASVSDARQVVALKRD